MSKLWKTVPTKTLKFVKPIVHVGFVPLIIYIAMKQEPDLTCVALCLQCPLTLSSYSRLLCLYLQAVADLLPARIACRAGPVAVSS